MLFPLSLPPGMTRPGTVYEARGRWYDGNLVRWFDGVLQPWGGWEPMSHTTGTVDLGEPVRGMYAWARNVGSPLVALGTPSKLYIYGQNTLEDITPVGLLPASPDAEQQSGAFGRGAFGVGVFGVGDPAVDVLTEAGSWSLDTWGEDLVAVLYPSDRRIFWYDASAGGLAVPLPNAPQNNVGVVVTPENFLMALGAGGDPRRVAWPDRDDITMWVAGPENFSGDLNLKSAGRILTARATSRETLIWTDVDLIALRYVGGEFVYGQQQIGRSSLISRQAIAIVDDKAVWMGTRNFYAYDGEVRPLASDVVDFIYNGDPAQGGGINRTQASKIHAYVRADFGEIVWHYPSAASTECDRYVVYNYRHGFFYVGSLDRTSGVDSGIFPYPLAADSRGVVYRHEVPGAGTPGPDGTTVLPFIESGPVELGNGDTVMDILGLVPDERTQGDTRLYIYTAYYPNGPEVQHGPYVPANPTSVRLNGRWARLRVEQARKNWRLGTVRFDVQPGGLR